MGDPDIEHVLRELVHLRDALLAAPSVGADPSIGASARNLEHYLELRSWDIRPLQRHLTKLGLSSLGRCEPNVLAVVQAALRAAHALSGWPEDGRARELQGAPEVGDGHTELARRTDILFGAARPERSTRIMVTLPSEAASDPSLVARLVKAGVDAVRINTAHDDPEAWRNMVGHIRGVDDPERPVAVVFDLAGPKVRTGPLRAGPAVARVAPRRDEMGFVLEPARRWLTPPGAAGEVGTGGRLIIPVEGPIHVERGDVLHTRDARGRRRRWVVVAALAGSVLVESDQTAYVTSGTELSRGGVVVGRVGTLPPVELAWSVGGGDLVTLTGDLSPADPSALRIGCSPAEILPAIQMGDRVGFDDGRARGVVEGVTEGEVAVRITWPTHRHVRIRAGKGINLPDSEIGLPALSDRDLEILDVVVELGDAVSLSFVGDHHDVAHLQAELARREGLRRGRRPLGIIAKIETARAFDHLPRVLRQLLSATAPGLMIARGDLAVEVGYERLAEVQEEILWLAEAAHVPVTWATEVLDQLARTGVPTRAEITDAAASDRAECVMLNKGPHVDEAVRVLADILTRMDDHVSKKQSLLRPLRSWGRESCGVIGVDANVAVGEIAAPHGG